MWHLFQAAVMGFDDPNRPKNIILRGVKKMKTGLLGTSGIGAKAAEGGGKVKAMVKATEAGNTAGKLEAGKDLGTV